MSALETGRRRLVERLSLGIVSVLKQRSARISSAKVAKNTLADGTEQTTRPQD